MKVTRHYLPVVNPLYASNQDVTELEEAPEILYVGIDSTSFPSNELLVKKNFLFVNKFNLAMSALVFSCFILSILFLPTVNVFQIQLEAGAFGSLSGVSFFLILFGCAFLIVYWGESCGCALAKKFLNSEGLKDIHTYIQNVRNSPPSIKLHVRCYHWELVDEKTVDNEGKDKIKSSRKMVVTESVCRPFTFDSWDDISNDLPDKTGKCGSLTTVYFMKNLVFGDETTQRVWEEEVNEIQDEFRGRDDEVEFWYTLEIEGYREFILGYVGASSGDKIRDDDLKVFEGNSSELVGKKYEDLAPTGYSDGKKLKVGYFLSSLFCFGYCFRSWFYRISSEQTYRFIKRVKRVNRRSTLERMNE